MCEKASSFQLPLFNSTFTQALVSLRSDVMGMIGGGGGGGGGGGSFVNSSSAACTETKMFII